MILFSTDASIKSDRKVTDICNILMFIYEFMKDHVIPPKNSWKLTFLCKFTINYSIKHIKSFILNCNKNYMAYGLGLGAELLYFMKCQY